MKKNRMFALVSATCMASLIASSQPVLTAAGQNPVTGDQFKIASIAALPPGPSGANKVWDFSSAYTSYQSTATYTPASSTPYAVQFPNANICLMRAGGVYSYYTSTPGVLQFQGQGSTNGAMQYPDPFDERRYPMQFNDSYTDDWILHAGPTYSATGTFTVTYDGYGSLIIPTGVQTTQTRTLTNVVRIHQYCEYEETVNSTTTSKVYDFYYWYVDGIHYPVVITQFSSVGSTNFLIDMGDVKVPEYQALFATIYPNPASDVLHFETHENWDIKTIELYDLTGKLYLSKTIDHIQLSDVSINVSAFAPGMYLVKFISKDGASGMKKILIN